MTLEEEILQAQGLHRDQCHRPICRMSLRAGVTRFPLESYDDDNPLDLGQFDAD
jgi:hypothetical protein